MVLPVSLAGGEGYPILDCCLFIISKLSIFYNPKAFHLKYCCSRKK